MEVDLEQKITEFDYERFLPKGMLENIDKDSPEFKLMIKQMNFDTKTKYEQHLENQKEYQEYM